MPRKRTRPTPKQEPRTLSLGLAQGAERVLGLGRERDRLVTQVGQKKRLLERCEAEAERAREALTEQLAPFVTERNELDRETHALFDGLLAPGRLPKRKREKLISIYFWLQEEQLISFRPIDDEPQRTERPLEEDEAPSGQDEAPRAASAPKVEGTGRDALRALFKRLAVALHPDRARSDADRARLTEVMKEVTRAYEAQDLARLLEIERSHQAQGVSVASTDERVRWLEQAIEELRRQLRELSKAIRNFKRTDSYGLARELVGDAAERTLEECRRMAEADLARLRGMRDHLRAFVEGRLSWERFVEGPPPPPADADTLEELLRDVLSEYKVPESRGKRRRRPPSEGPRRGG